MAEARLGAIDIFSDGVRAKHQILPEWHFLNYFDFYHYNFTLQLIPPTLIQAYPAEQQIQKHLELLDSTHHNGEGDLDEPFSVRLPQYCHMAIFEACGGTFLAESCIATGIMLKKQRLSRKASSTIEPSTSDSINSMDRNRQHPEFPTMPRK